MPPRKYTPLAGLGVLCLTVSGFAEPASTSSGACARAPCTGAAAGTVTGGVVLPVTIASPGPPRLSPYSRQRYQAPRTNGARARVEDVVVFVATAPPGSAAAEPPAARVLQRDLEIIPHVTAVPVGTEIVFPNEDEVYHNLFALSGTKRFNLGRYAPGESRSVTFDRAGLVRMFCDIHSDMAALVYVLEHAHFTRPAADGTFSIEGVPEGEHTVVAWHVGTAPDSVTVTVRAGASVRADFALDR